METNILIFIFLCIIPFIVSQVSAFCLWLFHELPEQMIAVNKICLGSLLAYTAAILFLPKGIPFQENMILYTVQLTGWIIPLIILVRTPLKKTSPTLGYV